MKNSNVSSIINIITKEGQKLFDEAYESLED